MKENTQPKSYFSEEEKAKILADYNGNTDCLYLLECERAREAEDYDNYWAWSSKIAHPAHSLKTIKKIKGAAFIKKWGFDTSKADKAYGVEWLEA